MGHWYDKVTGEPVYEVPRAKGNGTRPTTLADAKKLNLAGSVTSVLGLLDKPNLVRYKINQAIDAVIARPLDILDDQKEWRKVIFKLSEAKGKQAANIGDQIHNALENYYKEGVLSGEFSVICHKAIELIDCTFGFLEWTPEAHFAHPLGFGGKCDLHFSGNDEYPNGIIIDFKTKQTDNFSNVKAYPEHCMQLAAYREGLKLPRAECYNLFIGANRPNELLLHKWNEVECTKSYTMFCHLLNYWKLRNNI